MRPRLLTPSDSLFLYGESREMMFHVAGLLPFTPPPDTPRDHLRALVDELRAAPAVYPPWNLVLRTPELPRAPLQAWVEAPEVDLDYHVRRTALPTPGDERELGIVVSRLHGHRIDLYRPPWELHLIEGLERGRFAMYVKVHHALLDGVSAMRMLANALSRDPDERDRPLFFGIPQPARPPKPEAPAADPDHHHGIGFPELVAAIREQYGAARSAVRALLDLRRSSPHYDRDLVAPNQAPACVLNTRISKSRRFATQRLDVARMRAVARAAGATLNDVVLALSGASLRRYLDERGALPREPLVAMLPVSIRAADDPAGGNAVGAILASLATDIEDPAAAIAAIVASTRAAKHRLSGMTRAAILQYSAMLTAPSMLQMIPGAAGRIRPPFNVVISNVPGPDHALYFRGARLEASYPMSVPVHGQALNITCNTYDGAMCVGFTGCRETVPHLQRLAVYFGEALAALEAAVR